MMRRDMVRNWVVGLALSTAIAWCLGPLLLDSILIRRHDPLLQAITLEPDSIVRWHSEGSGKTLVGPHGAAGWQPKDQRRRIIWWGDSQLEGFCVDDDQKICNLIAAGSIQFDSPVDCISCGLSGTSAIDWVARMATADELWRPEYHVWLITEFSDLNSLVTLKTMAERQPTGLALRQLAEFHGEALFHAVRNIAIDRVSSEPRRLEWRIGPRNAKPMQSVQPKMDMSNEVTPIKLVEQIVRIANRIDNRLLLIYAPDVPQVFGSHSSTNEVDVAFNELVKGLIAESLDVIDMRPGFTHLYETDHLLPRGFSNSYPGLGHLNQIGNRLISESFLNWLSDLDERTAPSENLRKDLRAP